MFEVFKVLKQGLGMAQRSNTLITKNPDKQQTVTLHGCEVNLTFTESFSKDHYNLSKARARDVRQYRQARRESGVEELATQGPAKFGDPQSARNL